MQTLQEIMARFYPKINIKNIEKLKNKTFLITGASGLVGSNLISYLDFLNKFHNLNIKVLAIVKSGVEKWMPQSAHIKYLQQDLSQGKLKDTIKFNYLIHLATYGQPKKFLAYPKETVTLNINVLFDLLEQAKKNQATFLYPSSSEIYGEADKKHVPTEETYYGYVNTLSERAIYAESKRLAETICYLYNKIVPIKICRLLICYGPGVKYDDQRVYCEFIKKAQNTGKIVMMDEGKAQRTLCFISDAVEMILNILLNAKEMVYNISGRETVSIKKLAEIIAKINHATVSRKLNWKEISGTPTRSALSNKKYVREFNKKKFVTLEKGLEATSEWFKNLRET